MNQKIIEDTLMEIAGQHDGHLLPRDVVEYARPEASSIHNCFEWDDSKAAEEYRLVQARTLIKSVTIIYSDPETRQIPVSAWVSISSDRVHGGGYTHMATIKNNEQLKAELLRDIQNTIRTWQKRAAALAMILNFDEPLKQVKTMLKAQADVPDKPLSAPAKIPTPRKKKSKIPYFPVATQTGNRPQAG